MNPPAVPDRPPSRSAVWCNQWLPIFIAAVVGTGLRLHILRWQILSDDEWHAVRTSVVETYRHLLTDFSVSAAPPLPLLYKVLHDTVGLSEKVLRLPVIAFGVLILVACPGIVPERLGRRTRWTFAALLALSPILVYYSRYTRPYSISLLCTFVGVLAFFRWWSGGDRRWATIYVLCAVFGPYFHLTTLPSLLAPFPFAVAEVWLRRRRDGGGVDAAAGRSLRELFAPAALVTLGLGLLLGAPILLDWGAIARRAGTSLVDTKTFLYTLPLLAGAGRWWLVWTLVALAAGGSIRLAKRWPRFAIYLLWITACTVVVAAASRATAIHVPIVFVRYTLWILPLFLLLVALAVEWLLERLRSDAGFALVLAAIAAILFALGPIPAVYGRVNSWTSHAIYQYTYDHGANPFSYVPDRRPLRIPEFYRQLGEAPAGSLVIVEAPWFYEWHNNPLPFYQEIHRQWVKAGFHGDLCYQPMALRRQPRQATRLSLRNSVDISVPTALGMHGVDYVVLHKNLRAEMPRFRGDVRRVPPSNIPPESQILKCIDGYQQLLGGASYEDSDIVVFDVRHLKTQEWTR